MTNMNKILLMVVLGFALVIVSVGGWVIGTSNKLVALDAEVDGAWAQVESVLQRRHDLIPNLVSSVEGSMKQEEKIFTAISDARQTFQKANGPDEISEAEAQLSSQLQTLVNVIHEAYPELASNQNVRDLMAQLEGSENRIAVERQRFNKATTTYNIAIRKFPGRLIASYGGHEKKDLFEMTEGAEAVPQVEFGGES